MRYDMIKFMICCPREPYHHNNSVIVNTLQDSHKLLSNWRIQSSPKKAKRYNDVVICGIVVSALQTLNWDGTMHKKCADFST